MEVRLGCFVLVNSGLMICVSRSRRVMGRLSMVAHEIKSFAWFWRADVEVDSVDDRIVRISSFSIVIHALVQTGLVGEASNQVGMESDLMYRHVTEYRTED